MCTVYNVQSSIFDTSSSLLFKHFNYFQYDFEISYISAAGDVIIFGITWYFAKTFDVL